MNNWRVRLRTDMRPFVEGHTPETKEDSLNKLEDFISQIRQEAIEEHSYQIKCSDGFHNSFWKTVVESPQWELWCKENYRRPQYDVDECGGLGWISQEHFQDFIRFIESNPLTKPNENTTIQQDNNKN